MYKKGIIGIFLIVITTVAILYYFNSNLPEKEITEYEPIDEPVVEIVYMYGFPIDSFITNDGVIKRNQNIGEILYQFGIPYPTVDTIARHYKDVFDVRKIRAGNKYMAFIAIDSVNNFPMKYFVYEQNKIDYVVFDFTDSVKVYLRKKDSYKETKVVEGVIESSLWNAMVKSNINPLLAINLSEIYAWTVDFFGLQKNDAFTVIYEEEFVDSISIGITKINAALFSHMGKEFYAFPFLQDSVIGFFDENGTNLQKAFLKAPLRFSRISSRFSNGRLHPILKIVRPHHGVDYAAPAGTPVYAIGSGKVTKAQTSGGAGKMVRIKHNSVYETAYLHLSNYGKGIRAGAFVKQGDVIGYVGNTGLSTGPHLDFRFYKNGKAIDPLKVESPPADPIKKEDMERYLNYIKSLKKDLDKK